MPETGKKVTKLIFLTDNDEDDIMLLHEAFLSLKQPFEIVEISSGEELMEKLSKMTERFPDFIFLDIAMPGIDGFKCLELIKNRIKAPSLIKIIIYSGDSSELSIQKGFSLGADYYAVKPSRYEDLKNLVELVIENDWKSSETTDKVFHVR